MLCFSHAPPDFSLKLKFFWLLHCFLVFDFAVVVRCCFLVFFALSFRFRLKNKAMGPGYDYFSRALSFASGKWASLLGLFSLWFGVLLPVGTLSGLIFVCPLFGLGLGLWFGLLPCFAPGKIIMQWALCIIFPGHFLSPPSKE